MITVLFALSTIFFFIYLLYVARRRESTAEGKEAPEPAWGWPILGHLPLFLAASSATPAHHVMASLADRYGPAITLRLGNNRALLISSRELAKECLATKDRMLAGRPRSMAGKYLGFDFACFALDSNGPHWRETRKIVIHELLSSQRMESYQWVWTSEVGMWVEGLYSLWEDNRRRPKMIEMKDVLWRLSANVITRMAAGKRLFGLHGDDDDEEAAEYRKVAGKLLHLLTVPDIGGFLPFFQCFDLQGHEKASKETAEEMDGILQRWMEERVMSKPEGNGCFLDLLLSMQREGKLPEDHPAETFIKATMLILITAGAETTSIELAWALSLLMNNRHVLKKAQDELDKQVGQDRAVHPSDVQDLPYLRAIVKETLRLYPVGPVLVPHEATEDCTVGGFHVRAGTHVLVNVWKIHRDPRLWSDPLEFRPERFLEEGHGEVDVWGRHFELLPFGSGRRSCVGSCLAMELMHLVLGSLLHGFDWETPTRDGGRVDMSEGFAFSLLKLKPLQLLITPRLSSTAYLKPKA